MKLGRSTMLRHYMCTDASTLGPPDLEPVTAHRATVAAAISKVHLTPEQEQAVAVVLRVQCRLSLPVDQEVMALQQQLCADEGSRASSISSGGNGSSCSDSQPAPADAAAAAAASTGAAVREQPSSSSAAVEMTPERAAAIEAKLQQVDRLQAVQHKKRVLRASCWAYMLGAVSLPAWPPCPAV